jgi:hypothetical protein
MTTPTDKPGVKGGMIHRLQGRLRTMTITFVVLAVALIGLAAWVIYHSATDSASTVTNEIRTLLDDYQTAVNGYDGEAFLGLVTDDYVVEYPGGGSTGEEQAADLPTLYRDDEYHFRTIGDPIMWGDGPYFVAQAERVTSTETGYRDMKGISLYTIVNRDGVFLIQRCEFMGTNISTE